MMHVLTIISLINNPNKIIYLTYSEMYSFDDLIDKEFLLQQKDRGRFIKHCLQE